MKKWTYILWMSILIGMYACQGEEPSAKEDRSVYLAAAIEYAQVQSRVPYELNVPSLATPLEVDVWASTVEHKFEDLKNNGSDGTVAMHATARFTSGSEQLLNEVIYPKGHTVYFVGMHPQSSLWTTTDGLSASFIFDGKDDVMFAPQISGTYAENVESGNWPTLTFKHLLTWLRIEMVAEDVKISEAWGKLKGITIRSRKQVEVDLSSTYQSEKHDEEGGSVRFSDEVNLSFYQTGTNTAFPGSDGYVLGTTSEEVAYVLCAPVHATEQESEYTITITTEKRTQEVSVDLMEGKDDFFNRTTMGCQFTLLLRFKAGDNISVSAVATDWENGGMGTADIKEEDI